MTKDGAELHLLPLAIGLVVFVTAVPIELGRQAWTLEFGLADFLANIVLYAPLGLALSTRRPLAVAAIGFAASGLIEISQIWSVSRNPSPFDVLANTAGTLLGAALGRGALDVGRWSRVVSVRHVAAPAAIAAVGLLATSAVPLERSDIEGWDASFSLLLGNERTGDRPWRGEIETLALLPRPIGAVAARHASGARDPLADIDAGEDEPIVIDGPVALDGGDPTSLPGEAARRFAAAATERNGFAIVARLATDDVLQDGPARIVTFSRDPFNRNFDLGQEEERLVFRVRTPISGANGSEPRAETGAVLTARRATTVVATFDGVQSRIYVDGALHARTNFAAAGCPVATLCDNGLPFARTALGAAFAVLAVAALGQRRQGRWLTPLLGGAAAAALLVLVHAFVARDAFPLWTDLLPLAGGACVSLALPMGKAKKPVENASPE